MSKGYILLCVVLTLTCLAVTIIIRLKYTCNKYYAKVFFTRWLVIILLRFTNFWAEFPFLVLICLYVPTKSVWDTMRIKGSNESFNWMSWVYTVQQELNIRKSVRKYPKDRTKENQNYTCRNRSSKFFKLFYMQQRKYTIFENDWKRSLSKTMPNTNFRNIIPFLIPFLS